VYERFPIAGTLVVTKQQGGGYRHNAVLFYGFTVTEGSEYQKNAETYTGLD